MSNDARKPVFMVSDQVAIGRQPKLVSCEPVAMQGSNTKQLDI